MRHFHVVAGLAGGRPCYHSEAMLTRREARADLADHVEAVCLVLDEDAEEYLLDQLEGSPDHVDCDLTGVERWDYIEVIECHDPHCVADHTSRQWVGY